MKKIKKLVWYMVFLFALLLGTVGNAQAKGTVKLNKTSVSMTVGKTTTLKVKNASKKALKKAKWTTSNKKVAMVKNGKVTAKKRGSAIITVKLSGKTLKCKVKVTKKTTTNKDKTAASATTTPITTPTTNNDSATNTNTNTNTNTPVNDNPITAPTLTFDKDSLTIDKDSNGVYVTVNGANGEVLWATNTERLSVTTSGANNETAYVSRCDDLVNGYYSNGEYSLTAACNGGYITINVFVYCTEEYTSSYMVGDAYWMDTRFEYSVSDQNVLKIENGVMTLLEEGKADVTYYDGFICILIHINVTDYYCNAKGTLDTKQSEDLYNYFKEDYTMTTGYGIEQSEFDGWLDTATKWYTNEISRTKAEKWFYTYGVISKGTSIHSLCYDGTYNTEELAKKINVSLGYGEDGLNAGGWTWSKDFLFIKVNYDSSSNKTYVYLMF